ncbi:MAG: nuclear transport factor 2 family protein [Gammaproteobacteria bacterium]|nr:nuclear transport factor 2 family protein [Gammaproteobacteria bacterium]
MRVATLLLVVLLPACATVPDAVELQEQVAAIERGFAATMRERNFAAFQSYLADDAIFMAGKQPLRGKAAVSEVWARYFEGAAAPFSWQPETVVVQDSGRLALSTGPVYGRDGEQAGIFTSIWRRQADGHWRIIFDKGGCACN